MVIPFGVSVGDFITFGKLVGQIVSELCEVDALSDDLMRNQLILFDLLLMTQTVTSISAAGNVRNFYCK